MGSDKSRATLPSSAANQLRATRWVLASLCEPQFPPLSNEEYLTMVPGGLGEKDTLNNPSYGLVTFCVSGTGLRT